MTKKEKMQLAAIGGIIVVGLVVMVIYFRDRFLPQPTGAGEGLSIEARPDAPVNIDTGILKHPMYSRLKYYGPIDVVPSPITRNRGAAAPTDIGLDAQPSDFEDIDFEIDAAPEPLTETVPAE